MWYIVGMLGVMTVWFILAWGFASDDAFDGSVFQKIAKSPNGLTSSEIRLKTTHSKLKTESALLRLLNNELVICLTTAEGQTLWFLSHPITDAISNQTRARSVVASVIADYYINRTT